MKKITGKFRRMCAAFTLMEVNLAIFIMAVGVLAMTSLYPLGFRESQQAHDDVHAAIVADEVLGQLSAVLSSRSLTWKEWYETVKSAVDKSNDGGAGAGWFAYFTRGRNAGTYVVRNDVNEKAQQVFDIFKNCPNSGDLKWNYDPKYAQGLVVQWGRRIVDGGDKEDYSRASISFRMAGRKGALMAAPIYYTEVHFQGDQKDMEQ